MGLQTEVHFDQADFNNNVKDFPKNIIANTDPAAYKAAAQDFMQLNRVDFTNKYPEMKKAVDMIRHVDSSVHLPSGNNITSADANAYVRESIISSLAEKIAEGNYALVDKEKSKAISDTFLNAVNQQQRESAIKKYPELATAFTFQDDMNTIDATSSQGTHSHIAEQILKGRIPAVDASVHEIAKQIRAEPEKIKAPALEM